jgi:predicted DNA-binding antitoxin AbrB/MazE fold protein
MSSQIPAVFSDGVFRPLVPVMIPDGTQVQMEVSEVATASMSSESLQSSWQNYLAEVKALPDDSPLDGLSNRDHDKILYGP